jgi:hypothetical protein
VTTLLPPGMLFSAAQVEYAVSDTTGVALIKRETGHDDDPTNVYKATFDPVTLAAVVTPFSTDPYVSLRFISSDGEAYASGETGGMFGSNDTQVAAGLWAGLGGTASARVGPETDIHPTFSFLPGSSYSTNRASHPLTVGIAFDQAIPGAVPLSEGEWRFLRDTALTAVRAAYQGYAVDVSEVESTKQYERYIYVKNELSPIGADGRTDPLKRFSDVYFWNIDQTMRSLSRLQCRLLNFNECAQQPGNSRPQLLEALGRGIGNTAAHELGHQGWAWEQFNLHAGDLECYDSPTAVGQDAKFFGTLHWSKDAKERMRRVLTLR